MTEKKKEELKEPIIDRQKDADDLLAGIVSGKKADDTEIKRDDFVEDEKKKDDGFSEDKDDGFTKEEKDDDSKKETSKDDTSEEDKDDDKKEEEKEEAKKDESKKDDTEEDEDEDDEAGDGKGDEKEDDEEVDEVEDLKKQIEAQRKTLSEMINPPEKKVKVEEKEDEKKEEQKIEKKGKDYVFVTQETLDDMEEEIGVSADFLNEFGNNIANIIKKEALTDTSRIVKSHIDETQKIRDLASSFYKKNPDLDKDDIKAFVGYRVNVLASEHPDWAYEKLFSELGTDVRNKLGLKNLAKKVESERKKKPAFVKKVKSKSGTEKKEATKIEKEIDELLPKM